MSFLGLGEVEGMFDGSGYVLDLCNMCPYGPIVP